LVYFVRFNLNVAVTIVGVFIAFSTAADYRTIQLVSSCRYRLGYYKAPVRTFFISTGTHAAGTRLRAQGGANSGGLSQLRDCLCAGSIYRHGFTVRSSAGRRQRLRRTGGLRTALPRRALERRAGARWALLVQGKVCCVS
jgi:hypothetical protein